MLDHLITGRGQKKLLLGPKSVPHLPKGFGTPKSIGSIGQFYVFSTKNFTTPTHPYFASSNKVPENMFSFDPFPN